MPKSPEGRKYKDMDPVFVLLRPGFEKELKKLNDADRAVRHLAYVYHDIFFKGGKAWQSKSAGGMDPRADKYFNNDRDTKEHWIGLFEMLKASDYHNRNDVMRAADNYIANMGEDGKNLPQAKIKELGEMALEALNEVYVS